MALFDFVQGVEGKTIGSGVTTQATSAFALTAGNDVTVFVHTRGQDPTLPAITDTAGNVYEFAGRLLNVSSEEGYAYYCSNCLGHATNVVTATFANATIVAHVIARETVGGAGLKLLDIFATGAINGVTVTSDSFTPNAAAELIVAFAFNDSGATYTAGSGYGNLTGSSWSNSQQKTISSSSGQTAEMVASGSVIQGLIVLSFTAAASLVPAQFFGDSLTRGAGVTAAQRFSGLLSGAETWLENNFGVDGTQLADNITVASIYNTPKSTGSRSMHLAGYNDMRYIGSNAGGKADFQDCLYALAAFNAISDSSRHWYTDASLNGIWVAPVTNVWGRVGYVYTTTSGAKATFTVSGSTIAIGVIRLTSGGGTFSVKVDGVTKISGQTCVMSMATQAGQTVQPGLALITGLSAGSHTVEFINDGFSIVGFTWYAGFSSSPGPIVVLGGTPRMRKDGGNDGYTLNAPYNAGSDAIADSYQTLVSTVASTLLAAGLEVIYAFATLVQDSTDYQGDYVHFNTSGHTKWAAAIEAALPLPTFVSASVPSAGTSVVVELGTIVTPPLLPSSSVTGWTVKVGGVSKSITSVSRTASGEITIVMAAVIYSTDTVTVSYAPGNVTDSASTPNSMAVLVAQGVTNNSTQQAPSSGSRRRAGAAMLMGL